MADLRGGRRVYYHYSTVDPAIPNLTHTNEKQMKSKEIPIEIKCQKIIEMFPHTDLHTLAREIMKTTNCVTLRWPLLDKNGTFRVTIKSYLHFYSDTVAYTLGIIDQNEPQCEFWDKKPHF